MSLVPPSLDDRRYDDLVAQARSLIPRYLPEWTNHNDADPGITLLQLFGWYTDLLLYRVNQTPELNFIKYLQLLGITTAPATPAAVDLTFTTAKPTVDVVVPTGTQVSGPGADGKPVIVRTAGGFHGDRRAAVRPSRPSTGPPTGTSRRRTPRPASCSPRSGRTRRPGRRCCWGSAGRRRARPTRSRSCATSPRRRAARWRRRERQPCPHRASSRTSTSTASAGSRWGWSGTRPRASPPPAGSSSSGRASRRPGRCSARSPRSCTGCGSGWCPAPTSAGPRWSGSCSTPCPPARR